MRKIRVLHIGLSSNVGGIETVVHNWFQEMNREEFQFDFINLEDRPLAFESEFVEAGCHIYRVPQRKKHPLKSYFSLKDVIEHGDYDFVHCHAMSLSWPEPVLITNRFSNAKPIMHVHTMIGPNTSMWRRTLHKIGEARLSNQSYIKLACGYEAGKSFFHEKYFEVIENGINLREKCFSEDSRKRIRDQYHIPPDTIVIGHVGRVTPEKNYPFIMETFSKMLQRKENFLLMLVGVSDQERKIRQQIEKYKLQGNVVCCGRVNNVREYLSAMDIFFLPSTFEGLSVALVEAQASGLPCIVSEKVARESAISKNVRFIPIDNSDYAGEVISTARIFTRAERSHLDLKPEYDIRNTIVKLEKFYKEHNCV